MQWEKKNPSVSSRKAKPEEHYSWNQAVPRTMRISLWRMERLSGQEGRWERRSALEGATGRRK